MTWDKDVTATALIGSWKHGKRADASAKSGEAENASSRGENGGVARKSLEERRDALEADVRLARAMQEAAHAAMIEAGRTPGYAAVRAEIQGNAAVSALNDELAALRAEVVRLESENGRLRGELREGHVGQLHAELARAVEANERLEADKDVAEQRARARLKEEHDSAMRGAALVIEDVKRERDAARAALDGLRADVRYVAPIVHGLHRDVGVASWRECPCWVCTCLRGAVARAGAARGGADDPV